MRYEAPSIIEALCEFVFAPGAPWDFTVFGRFDGFLNGALPIREQVEVMALNVRNLGSGIEQEMVREPRLRFFDANKTRLAQVGPNLLSSNVLPPYPHWPTFRAFILDNLDAYVKAATPVKIERMTLRYIDRITPEASARFRLGDWILAGSAYVPSSLGDSTISAQSRVQKQTSEGAEVVTVVLQADEAQQPSIMLDTELAEQNVSLDRAGIQARLDGLHNRVIDIFESCISAKTRSLLKPETV